MRIERLQQDYDISLRWVHFPLHPDTPTEGRSLAELFAGRDFDLDAMHERMQTLMTAEGLSYSKRTHTRNSRLAQELGKWADTQPGGTVIHDALYRAFFVDSKDISDRLTLVEIATRVGLDGALAERVLSERQFSAAVDADWAESQQYGITGVPTFVAEGIAVVGAQPYEVLERLIQKAQEQVDR